MAIKVPRACRHCSFISEEDKCPRCGNETSRDWQGYVVVIDPKHSDIARKMGVTQAGKYALRVR